MDRANTAEIENKYASESNSNSTLEKYADENGEKYRLPYDKVREVVFSNIPSSELIDIPHCARLQYRLLLNTAILKAKVEFVNRKITIVYNPKGSNSASASIDLVDIVKMLETEGVHVDITGAEQREVDYYKEIWYPQFHPPTIREHPPYGYTLDQWRKMKDKYVAEVEKARKKKLESFEEWQKKYEKEHPEVFQ